MPLAYSILDSDLYKFAMQLFAVRYFPRENVRYSLINRDGRQFPRGFAEKLREFIRAMPDLSLSNPEYEFLRSNCHYLDAAYLDYLKAYRFNPDEVLVEQDGGDLRIVIEGPWHRTILWEVPLMSAISELYFDMIGIALPEERILTDINRKKAEIFLENGIRFADFGTRRRFSFLNQSKVIRDMKRFANASFSGTSNVFFAFEHGLRPVGTQAHELFSLMAAIYGFDRANGMAMEKWADIYKGELGIVLTDTFGSDFFLKSFSARFAEFFSGVRQDSGNPIEFADKFIGHYKRLGIDPITKTIIFSDDLNTSKVLDIERHCRGRIGTSYGIGTFLTNDIPGVKPLNIVIKLVARKSGNDWTPAVKLTDDESKRTGDEKAISSCISTINK